MGRQVSKKGKGTYLVYKSDNRVLINKIKKLVRHIKRFPNDELARDNLERIKSNGYKPRAKPLIPGSNPTTPKVKQYVMPKGITLSKTAGEQLSELFGIPLIRTTRRPKRKAKVTVKKKRYVKT